MLKVGALCQDRSSFRLPSSGLRCVLIEPMRLRAGLSPVIALLLLSMLWAAGWLLPDLYPRSGADSASQPLGQAVLFSAFAAICFAIAVAQRLDFPGGRNAWAWTMVGLGLFVVPTVAASFAQNWISNYDEVAVLCLTPVFAVVLEPYLQGSAPPRGRAALPAALTAMAGILCFLPLETPRSLRSYVALIVLVTAALGVAAANCLGVRLACASAKRSVLPSAGQASGAAALCYVVIAAVHRNYAWTSHGFYAYLFKPFLIEIPGLFLLFWLMSRLSASRMTARFLLAPLFVSLTGLVMEQMLPPFRSLLGLVLLAAGCIWLVIAPPESGTGDLISLKAATVEPLNRPSED